MSRTHNKLQHVNNFYHWTFSDLVRDLKYFSFSHHNPYPNPTYLPKHEFPSQFYLRILIISFIYVFGM